MARAAGGGTRSGARGNARGAVRAAEGRELESTFPKRREPHPERTCSKGGDR